MYDVNYIIIIIIINALPEITNPSQFPTLRSNSQTLANAHLRAV